MVSTVWRHTAVDSFDGHLLATSVEDIWKFMKAQMLVGYDVLSPWCAGAIMFNA